MQDEKSIIPSYIDNTNFRYLKVDNKYIASIIISDYPREIDVFEFIEALLNNVSYDMSMYIQKQDTANILKQLSYSISSSGTELKTANENQLDIDILDRLKEDAKRLRRDIQLNNEEVYYLNIYITLYDTDKQNLLNILKRFQSRLYSKSIISNIANFRHLDSYILTLPLVNFENKLLKNSYRNITTSTLSNFFPFYTKTIFDKYGVIFGYTLNENRMCSIDIFNEKYLNANMCIFGSSGSGKSYFTKVHIIREFLLGKHQYIFDPEGEYVNIAKRLNSHSISFKDKSTNKYINILQITQVDIKVYGENVIFECIENSTKFLAQLCCIQNEGYIQELKLGIKKAYEYKGISTINDLYLEEEGEKIFLDKKLKGAKYYPNLYDMMENITSEKLVHIIKENIIDKYPCLTQNTNVDIYSKLFVYDLSDISTYDAVIFIKFFLNKIEQKLKLEKNSISENNVGINTLIYFDEIWKYISMKGKFNLSEKIFSMFKTIRKYKAGIVVITQDVSDFFSYENGSYGKTILNNSCFKLFFKLEYSDIKVLDKLNILNSYVYEKISYLGKGQLLMMFKNNIALLNVKANSYENNIVEEGKNEINSSTK